MRRLVLAWCVAAGAAAAQEAEMRAVLPRLGADDYRAREEAEQELESLVRKGGQECFDLLETKILPETRAGADAEITLRVERVVRTLGTVRLLWWTELGQCLMWGANVAAGEGLLVRSGESGLDVLDARTGALRWSLPGTFHRPLPGIAKGVVHASRPPDALAAYGATDGELIWVHEVGDIGGDSGREHSVWVSRGTTAKKETRPLPPEQWSDLRMQMLHVPAWDRTIVVTTGGKVAAIDAKGQRMWATDVTHGKWAATHYPTVAEDLGLLFTGGWGDGRRLVALDAKTGEVRWSVPVEGLNGMSATVAKGRLFATAAPEVDGRIDGRLHAFDAGTGERIWTFKTPAPAVAGAAGTGVVEIQAGNQTVRRGQISHEGDETRMWQARAVAGGEVVITEVPACRFGLRASDGEVRWTKPAEGIRLGTAEKHGLVWGASDRGEIVGIDPRDGTIARRIDITKLEAAEDAPKLLVRRGARPPAAELGDLTPPVFQGDVCFVTSESGWTIALRIPPFRPRAER